MIEKDKELTGFILISKPKDFTSYDCIRYLKKFLIDKKTRIGHSGTLDDFATGLLLVAIGRQATKKLSFLINLNKSYIVKAKLGELTDSLDYTGKIIQTSSPEIVENITLSDLNNAIKKLGKSYIQIPPIYSALKYEGVTLYNLARKNLMEDLKLQEIVKQKSREVFLYDIEILSFEKPFFTIKAEVSKGTYIRSLANDIAFNLNTFATTVELERIKIGDYDLKNAINLFDIKNTQDVLDNLREI